MLEVRSVSKHFGGAEVVSDVSLKVGQGSIAGLIGPNGAGKTTLFNLIAGSFRPTSGDILLEGKAITTEAAYRRLKQGLGRTFQIPKPFAEMTLIENMLTAAQGQKGESLFANWLTPRRVASDERANAERAMAHLDFLGLARLAREPARVLSGGQRKLLELGRVLMADPRIILLDEPGAGVNPALLDTIIDRVIEINRRGITFLIIEHNMDLVARLCGHVFVLSAGRMLFEGTSAEVIRNPEVIDAYLGTGSA
ncbi:ABC transporter ATP-binding protein [Nordella sp. HKS 07]|uniref:ABC transporter ATP-binding protein n=1 Tax=Nordella sp. HKS 07 TaxID=2712222 RepID=UPI0013E1B059|nr:ABC transporter ATP-binding protein [Nordella sp. HKS 07]QIG48494.1 ABC transporter ATP-binding protein [Nordella sp. HKS 07]